MIPSDQSPVLRRTRPNLLLPLGDASGQRRAKAQSLSAPLLRRFRKSSMTWKTSLMFGTFGKNSAVQSLRSEKREDLFKLFFLRVRAMSRACHNMLANRDLWERKSLLESQLQNWLLSLQQAVSKKQSCA